MLEFLPPRIFEAVKHVNLKKLYELRVRAGRPLRANLSGEFVFLNERGVCSRKAALLPERAEIEETLYSASGYSVYAVEDQLRKGFLTGKEGERIGVAGTYVYENGSVLSINSITSLCIRVPHEIFGCADQIYERCLSDRMRSILLLAPPGDGKTTILRELCRLVSLNRNLNILVSDERGELSAGDLGDSDVIKFADKLTAFTAGIRALRPELIVTDELLKEDYPAIERAIEAGIYVFASAHLTKFEFVPKKFFSRYVFLDGLGSIASIAKEDGSALS